MDSNRAKIQPCRSIGAMEKSVTRASSWSKPMEEMAGRSTNVARYCPRRSRRSGGGGGGGGGSWIVARSMVCRR